MPRRSIWKGSFVDAFLLRMKKKRDLLLNRKIWSRRSSISPEFVDCSVRIYNGKTPVRCKITEGKVGHKFGEFAFTRKRRPSRTFLVKIFFYFFFVILSFQNLCMVELCSSTLGVVGTGTLFCPPRHKPSYG
jgi:small subunit ribosomal protein S19